MIILIFFAAHWYLSLFAQTFLLHRYAAHGDFKMNKPWERIFYFFAYITMGSSYLSPRAYAILHRTHHAYTDTKEDPHSPSFFHNVMSMMYNTAKEYSLIYRGKTKVEERFEKNVPDWHKFDLIAHTWTSRIIWVFAYITFYFFFATSPWLWLLLPIQIVMGPFHGAIINWFAHKYGYRNFKLDNTSRNFLPVDFLMLGESYHNNHHHAASRANFGVRWFEIDPVYPVILFFNWLGIIKMNKPALVRA